MSNRELAKDIIDSLPEYKISAILRFLKGVQYDDEIEDQLFCQKLVDDYEADGSPDKHETISIEELANDLGVSL